MTFKQRWSERWKVFKQKKEQYFKGENWKVLKENIWFIALHALIVWSAAFFFLNLLRGDVFVSWRIIIINIIGAGCVYYLFNDAVKFLKETLSKEA
jgi:hypothetical protein